MRLLIVEDEVRLADTLRQLLNRQGYTADVYYDGVSGLDNATTGIYDLMVLDVMLPGMNGFQVVKKLREAGVTTPVLMLTAKSDVSDRIHGLDCGADYYLTKPFEPEELLACVRTLLRRSGGQLQESETLTWGDLSLERATFSLSCAERAVRLSRREYDLMELLMRNPNRVYSRETLLDAIWGYDVSSEIRTVDVHIRRLREKLELNPAQPEHILTKWGVGYYFKY